MLPKERELEEIIEKVNDGVSAIAAWTGKKSEKTGSSSVPSPNHPENNVKAEVRKADAQMMR